MGTIKGKGITQKDDNDACNMSMRDLHAVDPSGSILLIILAPLYSPRTRCVNPRSILLYSISGNDPLTQSNLATYEGALSSTSSPFNS